MTLRDRELALRPLTEKDWEILMIAASDPEVLYFSEGDDVKAYTLAEIQGIYRPVSRNAFCFVMELDGIQVGDCWLQRMNVKRLLEEFPGKDLRRIDLAIGRKQYWNRGLGTRAIGLLTEFGFKDQKAEMIFGLVDDYNPRSRRAFEKNGYELIRAVPLPPGSKGAYSWDLAQERTRYFADRRA